MTGYRPYSHSEQFKSIKIREDICARYIGGTPLIAAARRGELDCVKELLRYNANIESSGRNVAEDINNWEVDGTAYYRTSVDDQNGTAFLQPLLKNMFYFVSYLIEHGANVNATSNKQSPPLIIASFCNNKNVDPRDETGFTAVHYALLGQEERGR